MNLKEDEIEGIDSIVNSLIAKHDQIQWSKTVREGVTTICGLHEGFFITIRQVLCVNGDSWGSNVVKKRIPTETVKNGHLYSRKTPPTKDWNVHDIDFIVEDKVVRWSRRFIVKAEGVDKTDGTLFDDLLKLFKILNESHDVKLLDRTGKQEGRFECIKMFGKVLG